MAYQQQASPDKDTGWGLIFRLNDLWGQVEQLSVGGLYDDWNFKLDRIYNNLLYRNPCEVIKDKKGKVIEVKLCKNDTEEKDFLDNKIAVAKVNMRKGLVKDDMGKIIDKNGYTKAKNELYKALELKDVWLRKLMNQNKLYIKEFSSNPAGAMWNK